jgi:hypothetical protein
MDDHPELDFFNSLSGKLTIQLDKPATPIGGLLNLQASPDAQIVRLELKVEVFDPDTETRRPITQEEFDSVAFQGASIQLKSEDGNAVSHNAPNGSYFTVRDMLRAVEETERQTRGQTEWLGGIDVHHIYFEGIHPCEEEDGVYEIYWGS